MAFINVETLSGLFQWTTIIAIVLAGAALAYKVIAIIRDTREQKKSGDDPLDYYPPQESDDYAVLQAEVEYSVNPYENVPEGKYSVHFVEENARISINGEKKDYKNGDTITLVNDDVICSLYVEVTLKPVVDSDNVAEVQIEEDQSNTDGGTNGGQEL